MRQGLSGHRLALALITVLLACGLVLVAGITMALAQPPEPHQYIETYEGPSTCASCHGDVTSDVIHSVHYSWAEKMDHYSPIPATIARINWLGMLNAELGIPGGCGRCHVSGLMPKPAEEVTAEDRNAIDCLICHSPTYDLSARFPVQDEDGQWILTQDRNVLTARTAQRPTDENCLQCHQNVGGGPMAKRGVDFAPISDKHGEASKGDVHADAGMVCVDCHRSTDHKIMGYGPDIWSRDFPDQRVTCEGCHTSTPHYDPLINQHVRLDCRACHVLGTGGLIARNWTAEPSYDPLKELYSPLDQVAEPNSVLPVYRWFNGGKDVPDEPWPGDRWDETARIQPFKQYDGIVPVDASSNEPVPLKLGVYYTTGDLEQAIEVGAADSGMDYSGQWEPQQRTAFLQISHGVVGKEDALTCQECHVPDGRVDFAALGYTEDEVALYTSLSSETAGERLALQQRVVIPAAQPLPTPVNLSGDLEATRGLGVRIPWSPLLALLAGAAMIAIGGLWLWRQRPSRDAGGQQLAEVAAASGEKSQADSDPRISGDQS